MTDPFNHDLFSMLAPHVVLKFKNYHQQNPQIFDLFIRFARELRQAGRVHYGAKAIAERIRWHVVVESKGEDFKLGNNHISCYARLLVIKFPDEFDGLFSFRFSPGTVHITAPKARVSKGNEWLLFT